MSVKVVKELRSEILKKIDVADRGTVGRLIDAMVAWSRAAGLKHEAPRGTDAILKFRPERGGSEVWAIYPSEEKGGAKLSLIPGHTDSA